MKTEPTLIYLRDYQPHPFRIRHSDLRFDLDPEATVVTARHQVERRGHNGDSLVLDCEALEVEWVSVDEVKLEPGRWQVKNNRLIVDGVPNQFELTIRNVVNPAANTQLSGLYRSGDMLCTQCEAEGFRRITPAIDRPDNLATYRVTLSADVVRFPVLLGNGNLESSERQGKMHTATWYDPFPKPTYLFALVAGVLSELRDRFTTMSGREVGLHFFARDRDIEKCQFAMDALKRSMQWDEEVYGREYDLDRFNVVAVGDFNMGAMENKSLNIFNTKYVLADTDTATDADFHNIERVVAHEYFHNWSGNRVTCRDWFQLSLKEGFTVFRDQEFSADMGSRGVQRIGDVNVLRNHQFAEDAGPMAHPVRPPAYSEINNFYTVTIYEKGAEVVRMLHTLSGAAGFRRGTDLYFDRHDGEAVTTDDFVNAIADANEIDLEQFRLWYSQAGTPTVRWTGSYDANAHRYTLNLSQSCPPTPEQAEKAPFVIPVAAALFSEDGEKLFPGNGSSDSVLSLTEQQQTFEFEGIDAPPVPSLLRGFSAPVILNGDLTTEQHLTLFRHDDDQFNRWEAGQQLFEAEILGNVARLGKDKALRYSEALTGAISEALNDSSSDYAYTARLLALPGESWLGQQSKPIQPAHISAARSGLKQHIAGTNQQRLTELYHSLQAQNTGEFSQQQMGLRSLRDLCLDYLGSLDIRETRELAISQLQNASNMTDRMSALGVIASSGDHRREQTLQGFYERWQDDELVMDKWFRVQAMAHHPGVLDTVRGLTSHPGFDHTNPNKVYALVLGFTHANPANFHATDGGGYDFLRDWVVRMDGINPQIAARLVSGFNNWRDMAPALGQEMKSRLEHIAAGESLSSDVREIVSRALADPSGGGI